MERRLTPPEVKKEVYDQAEEKANSFRFEVTKLSKIKDDIYYGIDDCIFDDVAHEIYWDFVNKTMESIDELIEQLEQDIKDCFKFKEEDYR